MISEEPAVTMADEWDAKLLAGECKEVTSRKEHTAQEETDPINQNGPFKIISIQMRFLPLFLQLIIFIQLLFWQLHCKIH